MNKLKKKRTQNKIFFSPLGSCCPSYTPLLLPFLLRALTDLLRATSDLLRVTLDLGLERQVERPQEERPVEAGRDRVAHGLLFQNRRGCRFSQNFIRFLLPGSQSSHLISSYQTWEKYQILKLKTVWTQNGLFYYLIFIFGGILAFLLYKMTFFVSRQFFFSRSYSSPRSFQIQNKMIESQGAKIR